VGDIESAPFIEALRQFQFRVGHDNFCLIHVSLIPLVGSVGEQKTKPTQASVRDLRGLGLSPDFVACRSATPLQKEVKSKISMFCHVTPEQVIGVHDCSSVYAVPLLMQKQGLVDNLLQRLDLIPPILPQNSILLSKWKQLTQRYERLHETVEIVLVGKYTHLQDSYISVVKALQHAALSCNRKLILEWVEAEDLEKPMQQQDPLKYHEAWKKVVAAKGILVPGGFGERGTEGKISAVKWARENKIPFLGICLGLQVAVIEFARHVCGLEAANSAELDKETPHPVVVFMPEISKTHMGGTMRLGSRETIFTTHSETSVARRLYEGVDKIYERHRHRYEVNPDYVQRLESKGLQFVGKDSKGERMIILELPGNFF
jgi:CTP synthase